MAVSCKRAGEFQIAEPLYQRIQNEIRNRILNGELVVGEQLAPEKELAEQYQVSVITIKNALAGLVDEGLLIRIQGKGTFVQAERPKSTLPPGLPAKTIGLIVPTMRTGVDQRLLDGIEYYCSKLGYNLMIKITRESQQAETEAIQRFLDIDVAGLIIFPVENENYNETILRLMLDRYPLVLIDRYFKEIHTYSVTADNVEAIKRVTGELADKGHAHIAYISPEITNSVTADRAQGFELALIERGMPIDKRLWCMIPLQIIADGGASEYIRQFFEEHKEITAIITINEELGGYVYQLVNDQVLGHKPIELISFDGPDLQGVRVIKQQEKLMAKHTLELLSEQLQGEFSPRKVVVPVL